MSNGIAGSAKLEGTARVPGLGRMSNASPAVKRAMLIWVGAFAVLFVFHIGGANYAQR
jgi:hypothetical protein